MLVKRLTDLEKPGATNRWPIVFSDFPQEHIFTWDVSHHIIKAEKHWGSHLDRNKDICMMNGTHRKS